MWQPFKFLRKKEKSEASFVVNPVSDTHFADYSFAERVVSAYYMCSVSRACIDERATALAEPSLKLFTKGLEEVKEHQILELFKKPNDYQTFDEILQRILFFLDLGGNAYLVKNRDRIDRVVSLSLFRPDLVTVNVRGGKIISFLIRAGNEVIEKEVKDVIHFRTSNPLSEVTGTPLVLACGFEIDLLNTLNQYLKSISKNMMLPPGIFSIEEELTPDEFERAKEEIKAKYAGVKNAGEALFVSGKISFQKLSMSLDELSIGSLREELESSICSVFGVPPVVIGAAVGLRNSPWSKYEEARKSFYQETMMPIWKYIERKLNVELVSEYDGELHLSFDLSKIEALQENELQKVEMIEKLKDVLTINERRALIAKEPIPGGDVIYLPLSVVPQVAKKEEEKKEEKIFETKMVKKEKINPMFFFSLLSTLEKRFSPVVKKRVKKLIKDGENEFKKRLSFLFVKQFEDIPLSPEEKRKVEKAIEEIGEILREIAMVHGVVPTELVFQMMTALKTSFGIDFSLRVSELEDFIAKHHYKFASKFGETAKTKLRMVLVQAEREGWGVDLTREAFLKVFDTWSNQYSELVARTEIIRAGNAAIRETFAQTGVVKIAWLTNIDELTCPYCEEMNGTIISIEEKFAALGSEVVGTDATTFEITYDDVEAPPLHPNCRCTLIPIIEDVEYDWSDYGFNPLEQEELA